MPNRALLIGINKYRIPGNDLAGCVNDIGNMERLIRELGFRKTNIRKLADRNATQAKILDGLERLVRGSKKGDVLLVHYSGHGSYVVDDTGDENDRRDEILCPHDLDWYRPLRDDMLRKIFDRVPAGVNLTVINDCCHSGTNTRFAVIDDRGRCRYLPSPDAIRRVESGCSHPKLRDLPRSAMTELLLAGCKDTQLSYETTLDGVHQGAFTWALCEFVRSQKERPTYGDILKGTSLMLRQAGIRQDPQLEGRAEWMNLPFLAPRV